MMGKIFGKHGASYNPDRSYTRHELKKFLKQFKLNEALRLIGMLSLTLLHQHFNNQPKRIEYYGEFLLIDDERYFKVGNVPINISILAYLAMVLIESAKDSNSTIFELADLRQAANMYFGLGDPFYENNDAQESLIRLGSSQFEYDLDWLNFLSRTLCIYRDIWPTVAQCQTIDIERELRDLSGLSFEEIAFLSFCFSVGVCTKNTPIVDDTRVRIFHKTNLDKFINWLSCDYEQFRKTSNEEKVQYKNGELDIYEKYRFNPLQKFPIIKSDKNNGSVVPSTYLLYKRITQGLYHELADKFKVPNDPTNPFRSAFGFAFEEYIGILLRNSNPNFTVIKSPEYGHKKKGQQKTVDWIVIEGDKAVLIEVKQSGLFLKAKTTGEREAVKASLKKTIADGVKQIITFEENVKSGKFSELKQFQNLKFFERIVVTYDPIFTTAILNKEIEAILKKEEVSIPTFFYWHVMSVEQFEHIVGNINLSLYSFLRAKRISAEHKFQDFREYISYTNTPINNEYLANLWFNLFSSESLRQDLEFLTGRALPNFPLSA